MILIELQFTSGRYHATPWGRNVNEGDVEWPPSPFRLARALVDAWKRKRPDWPEERVEPILTALAGTPSFFLPPASAGHTRSYLSSNEKDADRKQLIFDAFVAVESGRRVILGFQSDLGEESLGDLAILLGDLNYLGRSESWIKASLAESISELSWNCIPMDGDSTDQRFEAVQVACLLEPQAYSQLAHRPARKKIVRGKPAASDEACSWMEALCYSTKDLLKEGWSSHPALKMVTYARNGDGLVPRVRRQLTQAPIGFRCAKYALWCKVPPRIEETFPFAKRVREHLMGIHKVLNGNDPNRVSARFSGKCADGSPSMGHTHAFYVPLDEDRDGRLDHLLVYSREPFDETELVALDRLRSMWQSHGRPDVRFVLTSLTDCPPQVASRTWVSATPFITVRHYRKGRGTFDEWLRSEIVRECQLHGLPHPAAIEWIPTTVGGNREVRWFEFKRHYKDESPLSGHGCTLVFDAPVAGPFTIGSLCHYGLGLFVPME